MDIAQFNLIRPLSSPQDDAVLTLTAKRVIMPHSDSRTTNPMRLPPPTPEAHGVALSLETVPEAIGSPSDAPLRTDGSVEGASPLQKTYLLLNRLNDWLSARHDRVSGDDLIV